MSEETIEQAAVSQGVDLVQAYKDLYKFSVSEDWKKISEECETIIQSCMEKIIDKRGDCVIKHSLHCVQWAKKDIYYDIAKQLEAFPLAEYFMNEIIKESDAITSQILYRVSNEMGVSLDTPEFSDSDMIRFELSTYSRIKSWLPSLIDTLDPKKKDTKNEMNPYDKGYSNEVEGEKE